jgi:DNA-binding transcriptional ArsR family regulator
MPHDELSTAQLRVLSHPTRLAFLRRLRAQGAATARALGREFDMDSGAASYHLRRLAEGGLIAEDAERGTRRERWWRAVEEVSQFDPRQHSGDPHTGEYVQAVVLAASDELRGLAADVQTAPADWLQQAVFLDQPLHIDDAAAGELREELLSVLARYRDRATVPADASAPMIVQLQLYRRR